MLTRPGGPVRRGPAPRSAGPGAVAGHRDRPDYREHAIESNLAIPDAPVAFSKFASCLTGPVGDIPLVPGNVDWEAELVVVIGRSGRGISVADAWSHVAGFTIGQDISERVLQTSGPAPQFGLAKSFESFGPTGPAVVTMDELDNPDDLAIGSSLDGEVMQDSRTSELIFPVAELVSRLSHVLELRGGDLIFTGTPSGVGMGRKPPAVRPRRSGAADTDRGAGRDATPVRGRRQPHSCLTCRLTAANPHEELRRGSLRSPLRARTARPLGC